MSKLLDYVITMSTATMLVCFSVLSIILTYRVLFDWL